MRFFQLLLLVVLAALQLQFWWGHNGFYEYSKLKGAVAEHQKLNAELEHRNKVLLADVADLRTGLEGIEERARNELGLIKPGETFVRILPKALDDSKLSDSKTAQHGKPKPAP